MNCNAEINCWPAETANLAECHEPLINLTEELTINGARTARILYGCRGWVAHHNADLWRTTTPVGGNSLWAIWKMGGAWLCHHLWEHYLFTQDRQFLERIYPTMKGAVQFFMDHLVPRITWMVCNFAEFFFRKFFFKTIWRKCSSLYGTDNRRRNTHRFIYQLSPSEQIVRD